MAIRIGTYNVNNLFRRASILQLEGFSSTTTKVLKDVRTLTGLLSQDSYLGTIGTKIVNLLKKYEFDKPVRQRTQHFFDINEVRSRLFTVSQGQIKLKAKGRLDWVGSVELVSEIVDEASTENTARVIQAVAADILCMVEVEDRRALSQFNQTLLRKFQTGFAHNLLIDGNDDRGIDVGLLSKFEIRSVRSHIDDPIGQPGERIFSRDCAEFEIILPNGTSLWLLANHFKSKLGNFTESNAKRQKQAERVAEILQRFDLTKDLVVVAGDFNDTPDSQPLSKLLQTPNLSDVLKSPLLNGPAWTFRDGKDQIDYILVSKSLNDTLQAVAIERHGIFSKTDFGGQFPHFQEVKDTVSQGSDHAAVVAEFNI